MGGVVNRFGVEGQNFGKFCYGVAGEFRITAWTEPRPPG